MLTGQRNSSSDEIVPQLLAFSQGSFPAAGKMEAEQGKKWGGSGCVRLTLTLF